MTTLEQVPGTAQSVNRLTGEYLSTTGLIPPGLKEPFVAASNLFSDAIGVLNPFNLLDAFGSEDEPTPTIVRRRRVATAGVPTARGFSPVWLIGGLLGLGLLAYLVTR